MDIKKITEINFRNAVSEKTHPKPYEDSRCYRKEKKPVNLGIESSKDKKWKKTQDTLD